MNQRSLKSLDGLTIIAKTVQQLQEAIVAEDMSRYEADRTAATIAGIAFEHTTEPLVIALAKRYRELVSRCSELEDEIKAYATVRLEGTERTACRDELLQLVKGLLEVCVETSHRLEHIGTVLSRTDRPANTFSADDSLQSYLRRQAEGESELDRLIRTTSHICVTTVPPATVVENQVSS